MVEENSRPAASGRRRAGPIARFLCGAFGALGVALLAYDLALKIGSGLGWTFAVRFLVLGFSCYICISIAVRGDMPSWLDI